MMARSSACRSPKPVSGTRDAAHPATITVATTKQTDPFGIGSSPMYGDYSRSLSRNARGRAFRIALDPAQ
jgi:hypothetical protein